MTKKIITMPTGFNPSEWSHKTKGRKPSNKDYSNATIIDPRWANLMEYEFVEFYKLKCH